MSNLLTMVLSVLVSWSYPIYRPENTTITVLISHLCIFLVVVIAGNPATGKTTALKTVVAALNAKLDNLASSVKLLRIFPKAIEDMSDIFGYVDPVNGNWEDGIFTSIFRKAYKVDR